jgi:hypothetical protein
MNMQEKYRNWGKGFQLRDPVDGWDMDNKKYQTFRHKAEWQVFRDEPKFLWKDKTPAAYRLFHGVKGIKFRELVEKKMGEMAGLGKPLQMNCTDVHYSGNLNDLIDMFIANSEAY